MGSVLDNAIIFAVKAHSGASRKGSDAPYIVHPLEALAIVATLTSDEEVLAATVLHDVVEDTDFSIEDIEIEFGKNIASYVADESENKRENLPASETWKVRKEETLERLKKARLSTQMITLADKLSNIRSISRDYSRLGEELWERFNQKDKAEHAWYYANIREILRPMLEGEDAFIEYDNIIRKVFLL